jgi:hypothetical protein
MNRSFNQAWNELVNVFGAFPKPPLHHMPAPGKTAVGVGLHSIGKTHESDKECGTMTDQDTMMVENEPLTHNQLKEMLADPNLLADQREAIDAVLQHTVDMEN